MVDFSVVVRRSNAHIRQYAALFTPLTPWNPLTKRQKNEGTHLTSLANSSFTSVNRGFAPCVGTKVPPQNTKKLQSTSGLIAPHTLIAAPAPTSLGWFCPHPQIATPSPMSLGWFCTFCPSKSTKNLVLSFFRGVLLSTRWIARLLCRFRALAPNPTLVPEKSDGQFFFQEIHNHSGSNVCRSATSYIGLKVYIYYRYILFCSNNTPKCLSLEKTFANFVKPYAE